MPPETCWQNDFQFSYSHHFLPERGYVDNISVDKLSTRTHKNISSKIFAPLVLVRGGAGTARRGVLTATETGDWRLGRVWQL